MPFSWVGTMSCLRLPDSHRQAKEAQARRSKLAHLDFLLRKINNTLSIGRHTSILDSQRG